MNSNWKHIKTVVDGDPCTIEGVNIWEHRWIDSGQRILVKDPLYGQSHSMKVYEIQVNVNVTRFAAGEFSNCIWGIYQES